MVFEGSSNLLMDAKGRIVMPTKHREALTAYCGGRITVTAHVQERCLLIYPEPEWLALKPKLQALPSLNKSAARAQRLMLGCAQAIELDETGRMMLPAPLRDYGDLQKKLILVGIGNKFELWGEEQWQASVFSYPIDREEISQDLGDLRI